MEAIHSPASMSQAQNLFPRIPPFSSPNTPLLSCVKSLFHTSAFKGKLRSVGGRSCRAVTRAKSSHEYTSDAQFYKVEAILRPWRIAHVSSGLLKMGIRGVTVSDVRGFGAQGGSMERHGGSEFSEDSFVAKVKMEIVVSKDQVEEVVNKIIEEARTGEIGDGKIFLIPVSDVIRVRTGERGEKAERMVGGRADMTSIVTPA
ncbi:hypothetical protein HPP92_002654 [Vanilla planifolia]|uniref:Nitrogen regulatory protein P-II homolog n=1 Tax=Vanilla planifolia TaxID=51239 RepID=A0A835VI63_VANPL|nr:hypothetical protein HPP92_002654 [Vanilla planifolia]